MGREESAATAWVSDGALSRVVSGAFYTVLLLAANVEQAESAVIQAIESWNTDCDLEEVLLQKAVLAALSPSAARSSGMDAFDLAESVLPIELRRVLHLPTQIRQCYVLRVLVRFPEPFVAALLHLDADEVKRQTCMGLERLAAVRMASHA